MHFSFRWVECQLQTLRKCSTLAAVRKVLDNLPESLEIHYRRDLENVHEANKPLVRNLLKWIAFSLRPVSC